MADENKATADYLELMERYNPDGKVALLGHAGPVGLAAVRHSRPPPAAPTSPAMPAREGQARSPSGPAAGCTPRQTPADEHAAACFLILGLDADGFVLRRGGHRSPTEGIFNCDEDNVVELTGDYGVPRPTA